MQLVEPAPHEFSANFVFDEHGLKPYFARDAAIKSSGGYGTGEFELDDERWNVQLNFLKAVSCRWSRARHQQERRF